MEGNTYGSAPTHYHREGRINKESHLEEMRLFGVVSLIFFAAMEVRPAHIQDAAVGYMP